MFAGCRNRAHDYLYADEWDALARAQPAKLTVIPAFSRDQPDKVYVQHRIAEHAALVHGLLERGAVMLVCGNAAMPKYVKEAVVQDVLMKAPAALGADAATAYMAAMVREGRFQVEAW